MIHSANSNGVLWAENLLDIVWHQLHRQIPLSKSNLVVYLFLVKIWWEFRKFLFQQCSHLNHALSLTKKLHLSSQVFNVDFLFLVFAISQNALLFKVRLYSLFLHCYNYTPRFLLCNTFLSLNLIFNFWLSRFSDITLYLIIDFYINNYVCGVKK